MSTPPERATPAMPPPTHLVTFRSPSARTYTVQELLAHILPTAPPPSSRSCGHRIANSAHRAAHSSSKLNEAYEPILAESLHPVYPIVVSTFRDRIRAISQAATITFKDPLVLPWDACSMVSESMVVAYLDTQVLFAAWQAVLRMVPAARDYDLEMVKQAPVDKGVPDQMFAMLTPDGPEILVIVEFKAPGIVTEMLSVIEDRIAGTKKELTNDWIRVTQQLRKYAHSTNVRHVIVLDERTAIYFRFPNPPVNELDDTTFLVATPDDVAGVPKLSMRELVVLVLLRALDEKGVKLCDSSGPAGVQVGTSARYRDVLHDDHAPRGSKRPSSSTGPRQQPKRGKTAANTDAAADDTPVMTRWTGWILDSCVQLEFLPDLAPLRDDAPGSSGAKSPDSGFHDGPSRKRRTFHAVPTTRDAAGRHTTSLLVERIITDKAAVLRTRTGTARFVGKAFGLHPDAPTWFANELGAYAACAPLQGGEIPYLLGVARVVQASPFAVLVVLMEHIPPGTTVAGLLFDAHFRFDTTDDAELARLVRLRESGAAAVEALHERRVVHNDLAGRNLLVCADDEGESVVVVDFDCAMVVRSGERRWESRVQMDRARFEAAFVPCRRECW